MFKHKQIRVLLNSYQNSEEWEHSGGWIFTFSIYNVSECATRHTKEDIFYRSIGIGTPCHHQLRRLFPVCITNCSVCCTYTVTAVAVCLYNCQEPTVQLYRQGKCLYSICFWIYLLCVKFPSWIFQCGWSGPFLSRFGI